MNYLNMTKIIWWCALANRMEPINQIVSSYMPAKRKWNPCICEQFKSIGAQHGAVTECYGYHTKIKKWKWTLEPCWAFLYCPRPSLCAESRIICITRAQSGHPCVRVCIRFTSRLLSSSILLQTEPGMPTSGRWRRRNPRRARGSAWWTRGNRRDRLRVERVGPLRRRLAVLPGHDENPSPPALPLVDSFRTSRRTT